MKKVISCLFALALIFAFVGCDPEGTGSTTDKSLIPSADQAKLTAAGINPAEVITPKGATFSSLKTTETKAVEIVWVDATEDIFDTYKAAWLALADRSKASVADHSPWGMCNIDFYDEDEADDSDFGTKYLAGSIVLIANNPRVAAPVEPGPDDGSDD